MRNARLRPGFTLVEVLLALTILGVVATVALGTYTGQVRLFFDANQNLEVLRNLSYATTRLESDLRTTGTNVHADQPFIVYAGADVIVINADYASNVPGDISSVHVDVDAPAGEVSALRAADRITIPGTSTGYPDTSYITGAGVNSPAETILFIFARDTTTADTADYVLLRAVNDAPPEVLARRLIRHNGRPFFQYIELVTPLSAAAFLDTIPANSLPVRHAVPLHGALADTGAAARVDRVRGVRVRVGSGSVGRMKDVRRYTTRLIRMPNAGLATKQTCGDAPLLGVTLAANVVVEAEQPAVELTWEPAIDEAGGEQDVVRYVLWRRSSGTTDWGDPLVSIPAGAAAYRFVDEIVQLGAVYDYAVAAQDCTPTLSATTSTVTGIEVTP